MIRMTSIRETEADRLLLSVRIRCLYMHVAQQQDNWFSSPHSHDYIEFCYVSKGSGIYTIDDVEYSMEAGNLFILPKGCMHGEAYGDVPYELNFFMMEHTGEGADRLEKLLFSKPRKVHYGDIATRNVFEMIVSELITHKEGYLVTVEALLRQIYVKLLRDFSASNTDGVQEKTEIRDAADKVRHIMETDGGMNLSPTDVAYRMHYNPKYLSTLINRQTGMTLYAYQDYVRLENACEMLANTSHSVAMISEFCGFHNLSHFFRIFKEKYNETPARYRKRLKNAPQDQVIKL